MTCAGSNFEAKLRGANSGLQYSLNISQNLSEATVELWLKKNTPSLLRRSYVVSLQGNKMEYLNIY